MKFSFLGIKIHISFLFCVVLCICLLTDKSGMATQTLLSITLHEAGHIFCMWVMDCAPKEIRLIPASVKVIRSFNVGIKQEFWILFMGPCVNFVISLCAFINYSFYNRKNVLNFCLINAVLGLFNILPVKGLDGGDMLFITASKRFGICKANIIVNTVSLCFAAVVLIFGGWILAFKKANPTLLIAGVYMIFCTLLCK